MAAAKPQAGARHGLRAGGAERSEARTRVSKCGGTASLSTASFKRDLVL